MVFDDIKEVYKNTNTPIHEAGVVVHNCDFQSSVKEQVKDYFAERYGRNNVCSVGTIGFMRTKSVLKDLGRLYEIDADVINRLTTEALRELSADDEALSLEELREKFPELDLFLKKYPKMERDFEKIHGSINTWGKHAGGVLVSDSDLTKQLPVRVNDGKLVSCWTEGIHSRELGMMGFIKMDILAIETLDLIEETIELINRRHGVGITFDSIPKNELSSLRQLDNHDNFGVFQFDTDLTNRVVDQMGGVLKFDDLVSLTALLRPSALQNKFPAKFGKIRAGEEKAEIPNCLQRALGSTNGLPLFQESAMLIAMDLAGMDKVSAYKFMKLLYKGKMTEDKVPFWKEKFMTGCKDKFIRKDIELTFDDGTKRIYGLDDKIKCVDGQEHTLIDILENGFDIAE